MTHYSSLLLTLVFVLFSTVHATTYPLRKFTVTSVTGTAARMFLYANGTMHAIVSSGVPATRSTYDEWLLGHDFSTTGITDVLPDSDFAAVGYLSLNGPHIIRAFYQTTSGDIRSTFYNGTLWTNDPTVIATGAPYGSPISAFRDNDATHEVIVVQYFDSNSLLTQRTATVDTGNWGTPTTVTT